MSMNRLFNIKNPSQGDERRVLALCSAGLLRSPTVAWVLSNDPWNYNTRAAGVDREYALIGVDEYLVAWADEIVCVSDAVRCALESYCEYHDIALDQRRVVTLDIPDKYARRNPELVEIIKEQYGAFSLKDDSP